jgi:lipopolysaccharide export system protein LptC
MNMMHDPGALGPAPGQPGLPPRVRRDNGLTTLSSRRKRSVSHRAITRRARRIFWAKRLLPALAVVLLALVILWPEFNRLTAAGQAAVTAANKAETLSGNLVDAHYRGVDAHGQPYAVTAAAGQQVTAEQVNLTNPKADIMLQSGHWVMLTADRGVYIQHKDILDLSGHVVIYRDDGLTFTTSAATLDLKAGFAAGARTVSVEGPFGTIDATGFAGSDKGSMLQFTGPARLLMNAHPK